MNETREKKYQNGQADDSGDTTVTIPGARLNDETRQKASLSLSFSPVLHWAKEEEENKKEKVSVCVAARSLCSERRQALTHAKVGGDFEMW
jgi:hypothetical protein